MRRRKFIALLGSSAVAWPLAEHAQQVAGVRRVGMLMDTMEDNAEGQARVAAFRQQLKQHGWVEAGNLQIDLRWGGGHIERSRSYAAELIGLIPDALFAYANAELRPLSQATHSIPIVFVGASAPVEDGYIKSFARPGGNITGFSSTSRRWQASGLQLSRRFRRRSRVSRCW